MKIGRRDSQDAFQADNFVPLALFPSDAKSRLLAFCARLSAFNRTTSGLDRSLMLINYGLKIVVGVGAAAVLRQKQRLVAMGGVEKALESSGLEKVTKRLDVFQASLGDARTMMRILGEFALQVPAQPPISSPHSTIWLITFLPQASLAPSPPFPLPWPLDPACVSPRSFRSSPITRSKRAPTSQPRAFYRSRRRRPAGGASGASDSGRCTWCLRPSRLGTGGAGL